MTLSAEKLTAGPRSILPERLTFLNYTPESFEGPWLDHQQIMTQFARRHDVLYVRPDRTVDDLRDALRNAGRLRSSMRFLAPGIHELTPSVLLPRIYKSRRLNGALARLRAGSVRRVAEQLGPGNRKVLYYWNPSFCDLVGRMKEDLSVFHMHDYYPAFAPQGSLEYHRVRENFKKAIETTDLVIACSDALLHEAHALGRKDAKLVENGVDFDTVSSGASAPVPPEFVNLPRPIIGHIGRINRKLGMDAIGKIARARPSWSVVLMGPRTGWSDAFERQFRDLLSLRNVHYVPGRGWDELPAYFNALDLGLMAYETEGTWMSYGFPLKVWEYFSLGKPVVSTELSSLMKFSKLMRLVPSDGDWVGAVEEAINDNTEALKRERIALARSYDWDARAQLIESLIGDALAAKSRA